MHPKAYPTLAAALILALAAPAASATDFVYEGRLDDLGKPANGRYDLRLTPYGDATLGATLAAPITFEGVEVREGRFRLDLELPLVQADAVWLEVAVRESGSPGFSPIPGRSKAIAAPLIGACWSTLGDTGSDPASNFIGTIDAQPFVVRTANARSLRIEPSSVTFGTPALPITTNTIGGSHANEAAAGIRGATVAGGGIPVGASEPTILTTTGPNRVTSHYGTIGGGFNNLVGDPAGTASSAVVATIGGGSGNIARQGWSTVGGGANNTAAGNSSVIGGGVSNIATGNRSVVAGGQNNTASDQDSSIGGGANNTTSGPFSRVGGGSSNTANQQASTVAGGQSNAASATWSTVGGGTGNTAGAQASTVAGGQGNTASATLSTVGGGRQNVASGSFSTLGGGDQNAAANTSTTVSGGERNRASGLIATVAGGSDNVAAGNLSFIGGGAANCAGGSFSWAGGRRGKVRPPTDPGTGSCSGIGTSNGGQGDEGSFVWADAQNADFVSTGGNQFLVRAGGGAAINSNDPAGNTLRVNGTLRVDSLGAAGATPLCRNANNQISGCSSSARYKSDIADLELGLATALRLHAVGYRWKDSGMADLGFVAEEIAKVDERLVTRNEKGDIEGVKYDRLTAVLANAVQELAARDSLTADDVARVRAENAALRAELERRDGEYRARLDAIEARLASRD